MPRLSFEEPKGGPLAKAAQEEPADDQDERFDDQDPDQSTEYLSALLVEAPEEEESEPGRHRRPGNRDTVLVVLKAATVAVVLALVGAVILLATAGEGEESGKSPAVPDIPTSGDPSTGPTTTPLGAIVAPPVHSQTAQIVPSLPPVTQPTRPAEPTVPRPRPGDNDFVRVGEPCDTPGAYAFTRSFEAVVCDTRGEGNRLAWRRIF